jgi:AbrB family looped-hinge helix DNA binding protein
MTRSERASTRLSTKGQVILPKAIRERRGWAAGDELIVEDRPDGVLLRAAAKFPSTKMEDVFGRLGPVDRVISIEDMNRAVIEEARRRYLSETNDRD